MKTARITLTFEVSFKGVQAAFEGVNFDLSNYPINDLLNLINSDPVNFMDGMGLKPGDITSSVIVDPPECAGD